MRKQVVENDHDLIVRSASLWEIAIKDRLGKLGVGVPLSELPGVCRTIGFGLIDITPRHALASVAPLPPTRDPFDRLLLAQAACAGCRLLTLDRALAEHPRAWRAD